MAVFNNTGLQPYNKIKNSKIIFLLFSLLFLLSENMYPCTTFIISGKVTDDGKPILFKQRDTDVMQNSLVYFTDGKYKYIGIVNGNADWKDMIWGGYNEAGFAIINSAAYNNNVGDTAKLTDQEGVVMKLALKMCETLEDFEELLKTLPKPMGVDANFGVIDASGGAAYYETGNYDFKKYDVNDTTVAPDGFLVRTNHSMRGDLKKGFGFCRFNTALSTLTPTIAEGNLTPQLLFNKISRNLSHSLTNTNLLDNLPKERNTPEFRFFIDYIPRESTSAAIMIIGAKDKKKINETMMWTILGFPLTSVAIPIWMQGGENLPKAAKMDSELNSPLCTAALKLKEECFPIDYDRGWNYINLSAVINQQNNGIMQVLQFEENKIFSKAEILTTAIKKGKATENDIQQFYAWIDEFLLEIFACHFEIILFKN